MLKATKIIVSSLLIITGVLLTLLILNVISFEDLKSSLGKIFLIALILLGVSAGLLALTGSKKDK